MANRDDAELDAKAAEFERWADDVDPATVDVSQTDDLRALADAADSVTAAEARVTELVAVARAHGRSWGEIGIALGVSRQAARQRFDRLVRSS